MTAWSMLHRDSQSRKDECPSRIGCVLHAAGDGNYVCRTCATAWFVTDNGHWFSGDWHGDFPWREKEA
jgi:hypothetical protein